MYLFSYFSRESLKLSFKTAEIFSNIMIQYFLRRNFNSTAVCKRKTVETWSHVRSIFPSISLTKISIVFQNTAMLFYINVEVRIYESGHSP